MTIENTHGAIAINVIGTSSMGYWFWSYFPYLLR